MGSRPARPQIYVGVRFRAPGEIDENTQENGQWSNWSNPSGTSLYGDDPRKVVKALDQLDQRRCEGGELSTSQSHAEGRERGEL